MAALAVEDRKQHARFPSPAAQRHLYDPRDPVAASTQAEAKTSGVKGDESSQRGSWKTEEAEAEEVEPRSEAVVKSGAQAREGSFSADEQARECSFSSLGDADSISGCSRETRSGRDTGSSDDSEAGMAAFSERGFVSAEHRLWRLDEWRGLSLDDVGERLHTMILDHPSILTDRARTFLSSRSQVAASRDLLPMPVQRLRRGDFFQNRCKC